jgi:hypothetical protein
MDPSAVLAATKGFRGTAELIVAIIRVVAESSVHATVASAWHLTMKVPLEVTTTTSFLISADANIDSAAGLLNFLSNSFKILLPLASRDDD